MTDERRSAEEIFNAALGASPEKRDAYLDEACGGDAGLRRRIEALLRSHAEAEDFLESPVLDASPTALLSEVTEGPGTTIGRYKLLQKIGEGGFGVVYMAEQEEPVRRRVALKIIKLGMDTKQVIARFEAERQALAMMDHPNIAHVYDAGATETGRPYFVMELVRGVRITEYCDRNRLSTRERLEVFRPVCQAVQHAHLKGIIHRDIKPSNVLVTLHDSEPVPKVIDFGIAKATSQRLTEKTLFTEFRQFLGTPEYMSPDQAAISGLDVDTRTDIYSLGVLLYELLTGSVPFDSQSLQSASYDELLRIIREVEPPRPSTRVSTLIHEGTDIATPRHADPGTLSKLMRGDLDWIVLKAMEKDRTRRYETASELAADINRYLHGETVLATPPTLAYRVQKFVRRHRTGVVAGAVVAGALLVGLSLATFGLLEARREANRSQRIADFLEELFISTHPEQALERETDIQNVLATARDVFGDDHATVAAVLSSRALQLQSAGALAAAEAHYRESLRIWKETRGEETIPVANTHRALGMLQVTMGDDVSAERSFREALRITGKLGEETLTRAETLAYLTNVLGNRGDYEDAIASIQEAIDIRTRIAPEQRLQLAILRSGLVNLLLLSGQDEQAIAALEENLAAWRDALPTGGPMLARVLTETAVWNVRRGDHDRAKEYFGEAREIFRSLPDPPALYHYTAVKGLREIHEGRREVVEVVQYASEVVDAALRIADGTAGASDSTEMVDKGLRALANACWFAAKAPRRAPSDYDAAWRGVQKYLEHRPDRPAVLNTLGVLEYRRGRYAEALEALRRSDAHYSEERDGGSPHDVAFIALAHYQLGNHDQAYAAMERLRALMQKPRYADDPESEAFFAEAEALIPVRTEGFP